MLAFEITPEDVANVLASQKVACTSNVVQSLFDKLDMVSVESVALYGDDLEEQTNLAYAEIAEQLKSDIDLLRG